MKALSHFKQVNDYYCGPAILQIISAAYGTSVTQEQAAALLGTTEENGSSVEALMQSLKKEGLSVTGGNKQTLVDLRKALDEGKIVVVCYVELHLQWDHYAIVQGFDGSEISLLDPAEDDDTYHLPLAEFEKRWMGPLFTHTDHWAIYVDRAAV